MGQKRHEGSSRRPIPIHFVTHDLPLTLEFRERAESAIHRLRRLFPNMQEAEVEVRKERGRYIVEVTLKIARYLSRAQEKAPSLRAAFDKVMAKINRQVHRYKERLIDRSRQAPPVPSALAPQPEAPPPPQRIARVKRFPVKPMTLEEAVMQMDLLGHDFFVFVNAETGKVNVLYRREAGDLGLLEPGEEEEE